MCRSRPAEPPFNLSPSALAEDPDASVDSGRSAESQGMGRRERERGSREDLKRRRAAKQGPVCGVNRSVRGCWAAEVERGEQRSDASVPVGLADSLFNDGWRPSRARL